MISLDRAFSAPIHIDDFPTPAPLRREVHLNCILLVDDDRATNFLNKRLLEKMGLADTINFARNGVEAMDYLVRSFAGERDFPAPDLIFLDVNMPMVNGWEFLERYEHLPEGFKNSITVIMLTTSLREDDLERANAHEIVKGFMHKPLKTEEVMKMLDENFG